MIVRTLAGAEAAGRKIETDAWSSVRLLLRADNMGFSFHMTTIFAGKELPMEYKNHLESVYCVSGRGEIEDLATGEVHPIEPGTIYALDKHDKHILRAFDELKLACVFNPPLYGTEVHDADGAYPTTAQEIASA